MNEMKLVLTNSDIVGIVKDTYTFDDNRNLKKEGLVGDFELEKSCQSNLTKKHLENNMELERNADKSFKELMQGFFQRCDSDYIPNIEKEISVVKKSISILFNTKFSRAVYCISVRDNKDNSLFEFEEVIDGKNVKFGIYTVSFNSKDNKTKIIDVNGETKEFEGNIFNLTDNEELNDYVLLINDKPESIFDFDEFIFLKKYLTDLNCSADLYYLMGNMNNEQSVINQIKSRPDGLKTIEFNGEEYEVYEYQKANSDFISSLVNSLRDIEKTLIKEKLSINGHIKINKENLNKVIDFSSNYFSKNKKEIIDHSYAFDEQVIQRMKVISSNFSYILEDIEDGKEFEKGSAVYDTFKEFINENIDLIQKILIASEIYLDEENEKEIVIQSLIPTGVEYSMNKGFEKVITTLLHSHKYRRNTILIGHAGFGKTFGCKVTCQILGLPYYKFSCNAQTQIEEFFGSISQNDQGIIIREKGPLTKAIESGGLFVFDEFNSMPSETIKSLNAVLDSVQSYEDNDYITVQISGKDFKIKIHKDFRTCLTGNPSEFTEDYGILSRVTNDLSRRSVVINTTNLFSGKEFNDSFIDEYFKKCVFTTKVSKQSIREFRKNISDYLKTIVSEIQLGIGRGSIRLKEDNRFFVLNDKDMNVDAIDNEILKNVIIPVSSIFCLPLKNFINNRYEEIDDAKSIIEEFMNKHISLLFDLDNEVENDVFNEILDKIK